jgi:hypothetical protein
VLFLLRPPQTRLPLALPRDPKGQAEWNRLDLESYSSTRRVSPEQPSTLTTRDLGASLRDLAALHDDGTLTDEEFSRAKAQLLTSGATRAT